MKLPCLLPAGLIGLVMCCAAALATPPGIIGLGFLPGGLSSEATGISANGTVVVGSATDATGNPFAFRWTRGGGMQNLGTLPGQAYSNARAVSGNGEVVTGYSPITANGGTVYHAIRWTKTSGVVDLGALTPIGGSDGFCVNACGTAIAGYCTTLEGSPGVMLWTSTGGMVSLGAWTSGGANPWASGISGEGSTVVGYRGGAFRWTATEGMVNLGTLPGGQSSIAWGVSYDGTTIAGESGSSAGLRAFRWTNSTGMVSLGKLPGGTFSQARAVSGDGSTIVGFANSSSGEQLFVWTPGTGMMGFDALLQSKGVDTTGWTLLKINGLSTDGLCIVGFGIHNDMAEAWLVNLDKDTDGDGLYDSWETIGIPYVRCDGTIAHYPLTGASVFRKDIYVETDAMTGRGPSPSTFQRVVDAFGQAPLPPPASAPAGTLGGINLHVIGEHGLGIDDTIPGPPRDYPNVWTDFNQDKANFFGTVTERNDPDWLTGTKQAKALAFRYCIFGNTYGGKLSSGKAEGFGCNDFMVTLGGVVQNSGPAFPNDIGNPGGTEDDRIGTFMHELGHTLGLRHGGGDDINWKPNYYSVMNYWWQLPDSRFNPAGSSGTWELRYSRASDYVTAPALPVLNESLLVESNGVSMALVGRKVPFSVPGGTGLCPLNNPILCHGTPQIVPCLRMAKMGPGQPVNWDDLGGISSPSHTVSANVNAIADYCADLSGMPTGQTLTGCDDWANLAYDFKSSPHSVDGAPADDIGEELGPEVLAILHSLPPSYGPDGDGNCDGRVDDMDIEPFIIALTNPSQYAAAYPNCYLLYMDMNNDAVLDGNDIQPFVAELMSQ